MPEPVGGSATGWHVVDWRTKRASSAPAADGVAGAQIDVDPDELWFVTHAVVACDSPTLTTVRWYADRIDPLRLLDGSNSGNFDVADWPGDGLILEGGSSLLVVWTGAADGAVGAVSAQVRVMRRS